MHDDGVENIFEQKKPKLSVDLRDNSLLFFFGNILPGGDSVFAVCSDPSEDYRPNDLPVQLIDD